jgi:hypothetical protein
LTITLEHAYEGGSIIFPILNNLEGGSSTLAELAAFITVSSDFYPDLGLYYRALTDAWVDERAREREDRE